jgi:hypothetical protein
MTGLGKRLPGAGTPPSNSGGVQAEKVKVEVHFAGDNVPGNDTVEVLRNFVLGGTPSCG